MTTEDKLTENTQLDKLNKQDSGALYLSEEGLYAKLAIVRIKKDFNNTKGEQPYETLPKTIRQKYLV